MCIRDSLESLKYLKLDDDLFLRAQVLANLSEVYSRSQKNDLALKLSQQSLALRDSIYSNQQATINYRLNQEETKKETAQLKAANIAKDKINQRNNFIIALLIAASLLFAAIYHNRQQRLKAYQDIDNLLREQELTVAYARLEERDTTQKQIGQNLHDSLGAMLATIKLYFEDLSDKLNALSKDTSKTQHKTLELLDQAVDEVRRISHNMQSGTLKKFGLAEGVKELANTLDESGKLKVKVYTHGLKERVSNELEFKLYKIIQELVGNVLKHAKAEQLTISLSKQEELLNLMVEDNGIGFDPNQIADKDGIGLSNIKLRVTELGGTCDFDSVKDRGTNVSIDIPMTKN